MVKETITQGTGTKLLTVNTLYTLKTNMKLSEHKLKEMCKRGTFIFNKGNILI